mmetsp:Transcript_25698/g.96772  ORF Transcript_25698/g.96772 Transcript_25698/m.96772 type:complete len:267 (+) Transcript_25698:646-1446(+)
MRPWQSPGLPRGAVAPAGGGTSPSRWTRPRARWRCTVTVSSPPSSRAWTCAPRSRRSPLLGAWASGLSGSSAGFARSTLPRSASRLGPLTRPRCARGAARSLPTRSARLPTAPSLAARAQALALALRRPAQSRPLRRPSRTGRQTCSTRQCWARARPRASASASMPQTRGKSSRRQCRRRRPPQRATSWGGGRFAQGTRSCRTPAGTATTPSSTEAWSRPANFAAALWCPSRGPPTCSERRARPRCCASRPPPSAAPQPRWLAPAS